MSEIQPTPQSLATPAAVAAPEENRQGLVLREADQRFQEATDWVAFFRAVLGVDGVVRRHFTTVEELSHFEQTLEYSEIQKMVVKLRERGGRRQRVEQEPTKVITVRMPQSLHESLRLEATNKQTSMNKLCISKLLQMIDKQLIPAD